MTKLIFNAETINSSINSRLEETIASLDKLLSASSQCSIPGEFNASTYNDALAKVRKTSSGLKNVKRDLAKAVTNFDEHETDCKLNIHKFNHEYKVTSDHSIVEIN